MRTQLVEHFLPVQSTSELHCWNITGDRRIHHPCGLHQKWLELIAVAPYGNEMIGTLCLDCEHGWYPKDVVPSACLADLAGFVHSGFLAQRDRINQNQGSWICGTDFGLLFDLEAEHTWENLLGRPLAVVPLSPVPFKLGVLECVWFELRVDDFRRV